MYKYLKSIDKYLWSQGYYSIYKTTAKKNALREQKIVWYSKWMENCTDKQGFP